MRDARRHGVSGIATAALVGVLAAAVSLPAVAQSPAVGDPIRIGASLALTGDAAPDSKLVRDGYDFWAETVNAGGGIVVDGVARPIELVIRDDGSDRDQAARLVENLIAEEDVDFLLAPWGSGNTNAVAPIAERYQKLMVAPLAASDEIWEQGYRYLFGVLPIGSTNMRPLVPMVQDLGLTRVGVVTTDDLFPLLAAEGVSQQAKDAGLEVVVDEIYPPGTIDVGSLITRIQEAAPEALAAPVDVADALVLLRQMKERDYLPPILAFSGATLVPDFLSNAGADAEGLFGITYWSPALPYADALFGSAADYAAAFEARFGYAPTHDNVAASISGYALQRGIETAGSLDTTAVRDGMLSLDETTVFGQMAFDERGVNTGVTTYVVQIQDGTPVIVSPADAAAAAPLWPIPGWSER
ncbi:MAG: amino acid ABC transporter substrate-binding protein [Chloroflexi bacterium]|nr:amino acid ABC transporter substrate-binding protein [Chloroflexota bacterium]